MTWLMSDEVTDLYFQDRVWIDSTGKRWAISHTDDNWRLLGIPLITTAHLRRLISFVRRNNHLTAILSPEAALGPRPSAEQAGFAWDDAADELGEANVRQTPLYRALLREYGLRRRWFRLRGGVQS